MLRKEILLRQKKAQDREIAKTKEFIDRFRYKATKASLVQSRIKQLEKVELIEVEEDDAVMNFHFPAPPAGAHSVVRLEKVSKHYGSVSVFENVDFSLKEGASYAIVGKSGVGKTTFLNILGGLENPTSGKVLIDNVEVNEKNLPNLRRVKFGFIFQNFGLIDNETVRENLLIGLANQNLSQYEKDVAIKKVLKELDLGNLELNQKIYTLSGGEQQRVALARIIKKKKKIIFADEPTGSLDSENSNLILRHLLTDFGRDATILIATHSPEVWQKCDYVIKIKNQKSELIKNSNRRINEV